MSAFDRAWGIAKTENPADQEWFMYGGQEGTHIEIDEDSGDPITYFAGSPCPSCGGTQGYYEDFWYGGDEPKPMTYHWCGHAVDREQICGDCHSPITSDNPSLDSGLVPVDEKVMSAMRGAKGLGDKRTHSGNSGLGCKNCYDRFAFDGLLPYNMETELVGIEFDPSVHWRYESQGDDGT
tara:strand:- start:3410 stop:3949 length:540 start_codon:yes stop_codon:yes gene_type:complete